MRKVSIVNLREFEHRTGNSPCRNSLIVQDSVEGLYAGMRPSLAQVDNTVAGGVYTGIMEWLRQVAY